MTGVPVLRLDELDEGIPRLVNVGRHEIALVKWKGRVSAVRNICPHQGASLASGRARDVLHVDDAYDVVTGESVLVCPWHGWEFDVTTGRCRLHNRFRLRVFETDVRDDVVYVLGVETNAPAPAPASGA